MRDFKILNNFINTQEINACEEEESVFLCKQARLSLENIETRYKFLLKELERMENEKIKKI